MAWWHRLLNLHNSEPGIKNRPGPEYKAKQKPHSHSNSHKKVFIKIRVLLHESLSLSHGRDGGFRNPRNRHGKRNR